MRRRVDLDEPPSELRVVLWVLVAGLLHLLLLRLPLADSFLEGSPDLFGLKKDKEPIEIEKWVDSKKPVVQSSRSAEQDDSKKDQPAPYAGEFKNGVKRQTQSPRRGTFQEEQIRPEVAEGDRNAPPLTPEEDKHGDVAISPRRHGDGGSDAVSRLGMHDLMAYSQSPNRLSPDIADGNQTVLDTDPVRYASFINRIAAEIYDPWVSNARHAVETVYGGGRKLDGSTYVTKLGIVLDTKGEVKAIQTIQASGIAELDEAPKRAFWDAEPFRNPPSQMFDKDGYVRFVYEFHFEWKSGGFNVVPWRI